MNIEPYIITECRFSIGQLQVLASTLKAVLNDIGYIPDEPDVDGVIIESILFETRRALGDALAYRDGVK